MLVHNLFICAINMRFTFQNLKNEGIMFTNLFKSIGNRIDREANEDFKQGRLLGYEEGVAAGMKASFRITSKLSKTENELLQTFLIRHNFILCYDFESGGFRVRKNTTLNPQKETVISVVDNESELGHKTVPIAQAELDRYKRELAEIEKYTPEEREILGIF